MSPNAAAAIRLLANGEANQTKDQTGTRWTFRPDTQIHQRFFWLHRGMPNNGTAEIWRTLPYPVEGRKIESAKLVSPIGFDFCNSFVKEKRRESHHRQ